MMSAKSHLRAVLFHLILLDLPSELVSINTNAVDEFNTLSTISIRCEAA